MGLFTKSNKNKGLRVVLTSRGWVVRKPWKYGDEEELYLGRRSFWVYGSGGTAFNSKEDAIKGYYMSLAFDKIEELNLKEMELTAIALD